MGAITWGEAIVWGAIIRRAIVWEAIIRWVIVRVAIILAALVLFPYCQYDIEN